MRAPRVPAEAIGAALILITVGVAGGVYFGISLAYVTSINPNFAPMQGPPADSRAVDLQLMSKHFFLQPFLISLNLGHLIAAVFAVAAGCFVGTLKLWPRRLAYWSIFMTWALLITNSLVQIIVVGPSYRRIMQERFDQKARQERPDGFIFQPHHDQNRKAADTRLQWASFAAWGSCYVVGGILTLVIWILLTHVAMERVDLAMSLYQSEKNKRVQQDLEDDEIRRQAENHLEKEKQRGDFRE